MAPSDDDDDDDELARELDDLREFLGEDEVAALPEEDGVAKHPQQRSSSAAFEDDGAVFLAAAQAAEACPVAAEEASGMPSLYQRGELCSDEDVPLQLSEADMERVRREIEHLTPLAGRTKDDAAADLDGCGDRVYPLDDMASSASFLAQKRPSATPPPTTTTTRTALSAGLYDLESSDSPLARPAARPEEDEGTPLSYKEFLARLMLPHSAELVAHVRAFVVRTLDQSRSTEDGVRARKPGASKHRRDVLAALPERCAKFFDAAEVHLERHKDWRGLGQLGLASARASLEKYVMTKIGAFAFETCRDDALDASFRRKCRALATFVTPDHLDVKPSLCNDVVLHIARDELKRMDACRAPSDKVDCVVKCASIIFSALNLARAYSSSAKQGRTKHESRAGADDFLPVFIYVVLRADVPHLLSNCDYIQAFHNPNALMSKAGYCFVNLRSAIEFLLHLQGDQIGMDNAAFQQALDRALDQIPAA